MSDLRSSHSPFSPDVKPREFMKKRVNLLKKNQMIGKENEEEKETSDTNE